MSLITQVLLNLQPYNNSEQLLVGDGNGLQIANVGFVKLAIHSPNDLIMLHHVLHVAHITKKLLIISKLLTDNNVVVEFVDNTCYIKAKNTGIILLKGIPKQGLYQVQAVHSLSQHQDPGFAALFSSKTFNPLSLFLLI